MFDLFLGDFTLIALSLCISLFSSLSCTPLIFYFFRSTKKKKLFHINISFNLFVNFNCFLSFRMAIKFGANLVPVFVFGGWEENVFAFLLFCFFAFPILIYFFLIFYTYELFFYSLFFFFMLIFLILNCIRLYYVLFYYIINLSILLYLRLI